MGETLPVHKFGVMFRRLPRISYDTLWNEQIYKRPCPCCERPNLMRYQVEEKIMHGALVARDIAEHPQCHYKGHKAPLFFVLTFEGRSRYAAWLNKQTL